MKANNVDFTDIFQIFAQIVILAMAVSSFINKTQNKVDRSQTIMQSTQNPEIKKGTLSNTETRKLAFRNALLKGCNDKVCQCVGNFQANKATNEDITYYFAHNGKFPNDFGERMGTPLLDTCFPKTK